MLAAAGCGGTTSPGSSAASIVPASVPVFAAVDTDPVSAQWQALDRLASKFPDKQKALDSLKGQLDGLTWEHDLKPALGPELDVVVPDLAHTDQTVALMQPKDKAAFERAVKKGNAKSPSSKLVYETFHGWTVMSDTQAAIDAFEQASDSAKHMLADDKTFTGVMAKTGAGIVRAYVNGPSVMSASRKFLGGKSDKYFQQLGTLDWLAMTLRAKSDGIAWDTIVHGTPGKQFTQTVHSDGSLQKFVPKDALLYLAFHGSKGMLDGVAGNPILQQPGLAGLSGALTELGKVLQGENAVYVRDAANSQVPEITFIARPGGGIDGAAALDRVLKRFAKDLGGRPRRTTVAGVPARVVGTGPVRATYAGIGNRLVVTDLPQGIAFAKNGGKTLSDSQEFRAAAQSSGLPDSPHVVLYVDIHSTIPTIERLGSMHLPPSVARNLKPLRSAVEYAVSRSHELQVSFFLRIQ